MLFSCRLIAAADAEEVVGGFASSFSAETMAQYSAADLSLQGTGNESACEHCSVRGDVRREMVCSSVRVVTKASELGAFEWQNTHRAKTNNKRKSTRKERPEQIRVKALCVYSHLTFSVSRDTQPRCEV